ncbi:diguanylate cyclase [Zhongshania sp.]
MSLSEGSYTLRASIGWSIFPLHGRDHEVLLKHADQHMYEVKRRKKEGRS